MSERPELPRVENVEETADLIGRLRYHGNHCLQRGGEQSRACLEAAAIIERLSAERDEAREAFGITHNTLEDVAKQRDEARAVIAQHDLCHDLHGKVGCEDFAKGCEAEITRIYGRCPWRDEIAAQDVQMDAVRYRAEKSEAALTTMKQERDKYYDLNDYAEKRVLALSAALRERQQTERPDE